MHKPLDLPRAAWVCCLLLITVGAAHSQSARITGKVTDKAGKALSGVTVVAVNQTSSEKSEAVTSADGGYAIKVKRGAFKISVRLPYEARFVRGTSSYGPLANVICDESKKQCPVLENLILSGGDKSIDFVAEMLTPDPKSNAPPESKTVRDRWRIEFPEYDRYGDKGAQGRDVPFRKTNKWYNPYDQNVLKGDKPVIGQDIFLVLSASSVSGLEIRRTPSGNNVSSADSNNNYFFGRPESLSFNQTVQVSFELFKGQTVFRPRQWAIKISPTFSVPNYLNARENGIVNVDVRRGTNRTDYHVSLEDAFAEVKLFDTNRNYDFVSVRAGIQPFNADFRGFLYTDNNLGARVFGGFSNNKSQFNIAYFRQLEKDTNSGLNSLSEVRKQHVVIANFYRQDFLKKGYTIQVVGASNLDKADTHYDTNGFLVRPALIGSFTPHDVRAWYLGFNGDGHIGRINLTHSYYRAFGRDSFNPIAGKKTDIRAQMAAGELSYDDNWLRYRGSIFYASGDKNPTDTRAGGFDSIFDDPNFAGGQFSYWNRQGVRLLSTDVGIVSGNSLLTSLRSSKSEGQSNFVNPGIWIYSAGVDAEITQTVKAIFNANYIKFDRTESLEYLLFQPRVRHSVGYDLGAGAVYRPFLINNITFTFGGNILLPGDGFKDVFTNRPRNCPIPAFCTGEIPNPSKLQYSLFTQAKFIF